jgi:uncharacterized protein YbjQ (UPF0145 family)
LILTTTPSVDGRQITEYLVLMASASGTAVRLGA